MSIQKQGFQCDYRDCKGRPFREVYFPKNIYCKTRGGSLKSGFHWCYLCYKHFIQEKKAGKLGSWCKAQGEEA